MCRLGICQWPHSRFWGALGSLGLFCFSGLQEGDVLLVLLSAFRKEFCHVRIWLRVGLAALGCELDSVVSEGFPNLNDSVIPGLHQRFGTAVPQFLCGADAAWSHWALQLLSCECASWNLGAMTKSTPSLWRARKARAKKPPVGDLAAHYLLSLPQQRPKSNFKGQNMLSPGCSQPFIEWLKAIS